MDAVEQRAFGRTGLLVSALCIGTSGWGPLRSEETESLRDERLLPLADRFFRGHLPVNFIDTANIYGASQAESLIGRSLRAAGGLAEGLVLQTKLDRDAADGRFDADRMWQSIEESLTRLGLERVQVLYLHDPELIGFDAAMASGGPTEALVAMKEQGLAATIGISGGPVELMQRFVETDLFDALVTHNRFTLVDRSASGLLDAAAARQLGVTNAAPWGAGVLTGSARYRNSYGYLPILPEVRAAVEAVERICAEARVPMPAVAMQFSLREPRIHSTIVGVSSAQQFEMDLEYLDVHVPAWVWSAVDDVLPDAQFALDTPRG